MRFRLLLAVWAITGLASLGFAAQPREFRARVISVNDGDTMRVREIPGDDEHRIRLFGIDAPESDQRFGTAARDVLRGHVPDVTVTIRTTGDETYGRKVAKVYTEGNVFVNLMMVEDGWAWHYDRYTRDPERQQFDAAQANAREAREGLWVDPRPVKRECWRRGDRDGDCVPDNDSHPFDGGVPIQPFAELDRDTSLPRIIGRTQQSRIEAPFDGNARLESPARSSRSTNRNQDYIFGKPTPNDNRFRFRPQGHGQGHQKTTSFRNTHGAGARRRDNREFRAG